MRDHISYEGKQCDSEYKKLIASMNECGIEITHDQAVRLIQYLYMVLVKNEFINLTAIRDWDKALILHLVDSLTFLPEFDSMENGLQLKPFLDMGCGAGFPGIPLALVRPKRKGMLCDSVQKKVKVVDEFIETLGLQDQLVTSAERLEKLGSNHRRMFGCITARAVAALPVLIEYAAPLLSKNGVLILSKGQPDSSEILEGMRVAELCGLEIESQRDFELPQNEGARVIFRYRKVGEPAVKLPREIGAAQKTRLL